VSEVDDVSPDGGELLIDEFGEGGDPRQWSVYLRKTDGSAAVRLGEGQAMALSPDGKWALCMLRTEPPQLVAYPTGPGESKKIPNIKISDYSQAVWLPDGKRIVFSGVETGHGPRCYEQEVDGERLRAITPEGTVLPTSQPRSCLSADGRSLAAMGPDHLFRLYPLDGSGASRPIPGIRPWETPLRWSADGETVYVARVDQVPVRIERLDLSSGRRTLWKEITPPDPAGVTNLYAIQISPEQGWYFYSYWRSLSDLYVVDGLR
jgi:Tol biopolymer transport system component